MDELYSSCNPIKVEIFTLCEYADCRDGRLTIVGTLDELNPLKLPYRAYVGIALKIDITAVEINHEHHLKIVIKKQGQASDIIFQNTLRFDVKRKKEGREKFALAGNLRGLIFREPGEYVCQLSLDEAEIAKSSFVVREPTPLPATSK